MGDQNTRTYYHYTDPASAQKIQQTGKILKSPGGPNNDAICGPGTYLTTMAPTNSAANIARNNYDDGQRFPQQKINDGKVSSVVEVKIPKSDPKIERCKAADGRDVYRYKGDVNLKDYKHTVSSKPKKEERN